MEGGEELAPAATLLRQDGVARRCDAVEAPAPDTGFLDPLSHDPSAALHPVEHRIEGCDVESEHAARSHVDQAGDVVAMAWRRLDDRQDHQLGAAALQFVLGVAAHMLSDNIWP